MRMSGKGKDDAPPANWRRNLILPLGVAVVFFGCLCFGLYILMMEAGVSHTEAVLIAFSLFAITILSIVGAGVAVLRNPSKDPYTISPEEYRVLTAAAKSMFRWPLGLPISLIAGTFKKVKEAGKKKNDKQE